MEYEIGSRSIELKILIIVEEKNWYYAINLLSIILQKNNSQ